MRFRVTSEAWNGFNLSDIRLASISDSKGCNTETSGTEGTSLRRNEENVGVFEAMTAGGTLWNGEVDYNCIDA
jgi:hypothetical protein